MISDHAELFKDNNNIPQKEIALIKKCMTLIPGDRPDLDAISEFYGIKLPTNEPVLCLEALAKYLSIKNCQPVAGYS